MSLPTQLQDARAVAVQLGAVRTAIGAGYVLAPVPSARLLGADSATAARVSWLTRMVGVRDAALGAGTFLAARRGRDVGVWLIAGAVSDAVDAAAMSSALRTGKVRGPLPVGVSAIAATVAAHGAITAARLGRSQH